MQYYRASVCVLKILYMTIYHHHSLSCHRFHVTSPSPSVVTTHGPTVATRCQGTDSWIAAAEATLCSQDDQVTFQNLSSAGDPQSSCGSNKKGEYFTSMGKHITRYRKFSCVVVWIDVEKPQIK